MEDVIETLVGEMWDCRTGEEVYRCAVDVAARHLDADSHVVAVEREETLLAVATAGPAAPSVGHRFERVSFPALVYCQRQPCLIDDVLDVRDASASTPDCSGSKCSTFRSILAVPLGHEGVFVAGAREVRALSESDLERATAISSFAGAVLERVRSKSGSSSEPRGFERIADVLSHELRTPLQVARSRLELARTEGADEHLEHIERALGRIENLASDMASLARAGDATGSHEPVSLRTASEAAWLIVGTSHAEIEIETQRTVVANDSSLRRLLENLFRNAIEHAGPGVTVRVGDTDGGFYVEDSGPGIPAPCRESVLDWGVSSSDDSMGYGLSIVERIAETHGWQLEIHESEDGGARIECTGVETVWSSD